MEYDEIASLLHQGVHQGIHDRSAAEKAITLLEKHNFAPEYNFYLIVRALVYFPDLLERFLIRRRCMTIDDYECMVARCIEYKKDEVVSKSDWHHRSLYLLLQGRPDRDVRLRLLPKRAINSWLYNKAKAVGIRDKHYEGRQDGPYNYTIDVTEEITGEYWGYRKTYHLLEYGGEKRRALLERWRICGHDCTFQAACDYFGTNTIMIIEHLLSFFDLSITTSYFSFRKYTRVTRSCF